MTQNILILNQKRGYMKIDRRIVCILTIFFFGFTFVNGQQAVVTTGGTAKGSGGTVTYTVGQIAYQTFGGSGGTVMQGVQQPWEVSTPVAVENTEDISLLMNVFPNPTKGAFKLVVGTLENRNLKFRLYDMNGILLKDERINAEETEINIQNHASTIFFLKVISNAQEIKVFKIVKK